MYNPCMECKLRYNREYTSKCDDECIYANSIKQLNERLNKLICTSLK